MAQMVKHLPTTRETQVGSPGQEDPLEEEMATHSSTLAWKIPWTEERGRLQSMGSQSLTGLSNFTFFLCENIEEYFISHLPSPSFHYNSNSLLRLSLSLSLFLFLTPLPFVSLSLSLLLCISTSTFICQMIGPRIMKF